MRLSDEEYRLKRQKEADKKLFEQKIEEDRLGISRNKQTRVMSFMTYRVIKLVLLLLTAIALFVYTPAVLPLTALIALMMIVTKKLEKAKNKNINKKYRIKIRAADSIIAVILIAVTLGMTGYSLVTTYINGGSLSDPAALEQRLSDAGFSQNQINAALERVSGENAYKRIANDALSLMTGNRNMFVSRRMMFRRRPVNFEGMNGSMPMKRPSVFAMMRNMPLDMLFKQIFNMVCSVMVGIMIIIGTINVIESFKHGEIKKVALGEKFAIRTGRNDLCPCGSGKKVKNCCGSNAEYYK